jgi:hypothetical protein
LADVLDPKKLFPNSYTTLTLPVYNDPWTNNGSNKTLVNLYTGTGINPNLVNYQSLWGDYLVGVLPEIVALASGAFGYSMLQINNIISMDILKISQAIANLRTIDAPLLNGTDGPANSGQVARDALAMIANGGGSNGSYRMCDFFGAVSGRSYVDSYKMLQELFTKDTFPSLTNVYREIYLLVTSQHPQSYDTQLQALIDQANSQISAISANAIFRDGFNTLWETIGRNLTIEQRSLTTAAPSQDLVTAAASDYDIQTFGRLLEVYALDTGTWGMANVIIAISDTNLLGGQSMIAAIKEAQNAAVLGTAGGSLDNGISNYVNPQQASGRAVVDANGCISFIITSGGSGYSKESCDCCMPTVYVAGGLTQAAPVVDMATGTITQIKYVGGKQCGYNPNYPPTVTIAAAAPPVNPKGYPVTLGSLACGAHDTVPDNLRNM